MRTSAARIMLASMALLSASCASRLGMRGIEPLTVSVQAIWRGATPDQIARQLAAPLEREFRTIDGVSRVITRCDEAGCSIVVEYRALLSGDTMMLDLSSAIRRLQPQLPSDAKLLVLPINLQRPSDLLVALVFNTPRIEPKHYDVARRFGSLVMQLPSAAQFEIVGYDGQQTAIELDPAKAAPLGITQADVARAIEERELTVDAYNTVIVRSPRDGDDLGGIILRKTGEKLVHLKDVARISTRSASSVLYHVDGEPAIAIRIYLRSTATPVEIRACLARVLKLPLLPSVHRIVPLSARVD